MFKRQVGSALVLKELGVKRELKTFSDRLIVQKAIYLAQVAGVDLGYYFGWYLRGPYCSPVAKDLFDLAEKDVEEVEKTLDSWHLGADGKRVLKNLKPLLHKYRQKALAQDVWMELLASVLFMVQERGETDPAKLTTTLQAWGKSFTQEQVDLALEELKAHGLLRGKNCR